MLRLNRKENVTIIKKIVFSALILSLIMVTKIIESFIPDLPNGLGNVAKLSEITILLSSIIFGPIITLISVLIYISLISPIFSSFLISGIFYVEKIESRIGVYFLDYFIPLILISLVGLGNKFKNHYIYLFAYLMTFLVLISHSISGIIFFKEYLEPIIKEDIFYFLLSFGLNLLGYIIFFVGLPLYIYLAKKLNKNFSSKLKSGF